MATNNAEFMRTLIKKVEQPPQPLADQTALMESQEFDEAVATGLFQRLNKWAGSFFGGGKGSREVQKLGYTYWQQWQRYMQRATYIGSYADVTWKDLIKFVTSPGYAGSVVVPTYNEYGTPLTLKELQGIISDPRIRQTIQQEMDRKKASDPTTAPLSKILPANGNIMAIKDEQIGGPSVGADDEISKTARSNRAEIIVLSILEAASVVMYEKAAGITPDERSSSPSGGPAATPAATPATPAAGASGPAGGPAPAAGVGISFTPEEANFAKQLLGL